ncbi:hypothetical protein L3X38_018977 [Prunus dulcis]|uniref:Uncharacterized protein n=1 Tax=Prunus dulcis TaxID=3755 RepID=A0AAD4WA26_PRUDU|nr:hypothetical protein L3X38_018977 [Prunus dulcis]
MGGGGSIAAARYEGRDSLGLGVDLTRQGLGHWMGLRLGGKAGVLGFRVDGVAGGVRVGGGEVDLTGARAGAWDGSTPGGARLGDGIGLGLVGKGWGWVSAGAWNGSRVGMGFDWGFRV